MNMTAYSKRDNQSHVLARPMNSFEYAVEIEECDLDELEGEECEQGYYVVFNESHRAWYPQDVFINQFDKL